MALGIPPATAYDRAITIFSPEGKLYQVEYAFEAVKKGWTCLGIRTDRAVVIAAEKRKVIPLIDLEGIAKVSMVDEHIGVTFAGMGSDGRVLVDYARLVAARHRLIYGEPATVEYVVKAISDLKQAYTQHGGVRPFGVALIFGGVDNGKTQLFRTEPGGQYFSYYAIAIGIGGEVAEGILEKEYRRDMDLDSTLELAVKTLLKSRLATTNEPKEEVLSEFHKMIEVGYITVDRPVFTIMKPDELKKIIDRVKGSLD
ncbi:archaeal proteasome endopeptidase complex subunit alpha [Stetteria hydrogenophila]